jgi:tetratricopeptide (TPR) repeat protein
VPLPSPSRFGRYVVLDLLTGDPGEVTLLAFDPELDRKVGLKVFDATFDAEKDARRRDKARELARLVHPHVVRVHDVGAHGDQLYVAMDFVPGASLATWVRESAPSWRRRLDVLLAAGEGLAAAHAAGLVHGGFSAHAVVVGDDGQIRVIDFVRSRPNRHGRRPDVERDRIDFCATVYRVLWDASPWDDEGRPRPAPTDTRVPRAVRRAIVHGLEPGGRFATMKPLLEELRRALGRQRFAWAALALVLTAVGVGAAAVVAPGSPTPRPWCDDLPGHASQVWNPDVATRARESFVATGAPYAADVWDDVQTQIDGFVTAWSGAQSRDCARRDDPEAVDAAITLCLHRQYEGLRAFVSVLQDADREVVASAARTIASLGSPDACEVVDDGPMPDEPGALATMMAIESVLSAAKVQHELGRFVDSAATAGRARAMAVELGARALVAEADYRIALSQGRAGDEAEAERGFHAAFAGAVASEHHEIVARAAMELSWLLAEQGRDEEAVLWTEHAAAAVERRSTIELRTRLAAVKGKVAFHRGDYAEAREHYVESAKLAETSSPPDVFARMHAKQVTALCVGHLGDTDAEIELLREGLAETEAELGTEHPNVGHYRNSLASALSRRGSVEPALEEAERAQAVFAASLGPEHWATVSSRLSLSAIQNEMGRDAEAEAGYEVALSTARRTLPLEDPRYATVLGNVGMFYAMKERYVEAAALLSEAATRHEAIHGPDHSMTLGFLNNLAATHMFAGSDEEAARVYADVLVRTERALGADHPQLVPALLGLAHVEHDLGRSAAAVRRLERALEITTSRGDRPERIGRVQLTLADVLWQADIDRTRAKAMARAAQQSWMAAKDSGWDIGSQLAEAKTWLDEHGE